MDLHISYVIKKHVVFLLRQLPLLITHCRKTIIVMAIWAACCIILPSPDTESTGHLIFYLHWCRLHMFVIRKVNLIMAPRKVTQKHEYSCDGIRTGPFSEMLWLCEGNWMTPLVLTRPSSYCGECESPRFKDLAKNVYSAWCQVIPEASWDPN